MKHLHAVIKKERVEQIHRPHLHNQVYVCLIERAAITNRRRLSMLGPGSAAATQEAAAAAPEEAMCCRYVCSTFLFLE